MISNQQLEEHLKKSSDVYHVHMDGDGYHYKLTIVSDAFVGKSKVARQQWVYAQLKEHILSGSLHALTMQTWTREEWEKQHG